MVMLTLVALALGLIYGLGGWRLPLVDMLAGSSDAILYVLMFSVGISVSLQRGLLQKIRAYHVRILIIPMGIILGSVLGGWACGMMTGIPAGVSMAIASGMGWYSLAGATIGKLSGPGLGSVAFLSNLMREIFSFFIIPVIALRLNRYTCIAPAAATSEDTTLPMMLKYTDEETVVLSVLNGVICSFFVPVLISLFLG